MGPTDVEVAIASAQAGADVVRRMYGHDHVRHPKSATDFATETDLEAERAILAVLEHHRPTDARTGEESGECGGANRSRRWLVDPLCGTLNFAAGTPLACVNVALVEGGRTTVAAAADPMAGELFWTDGIQAQCRRNRVDQALLPSSLSMLVDVNCDGPTDRAFVGGQLLADPLLRARFGPRVLSSTLAVAWVAAGRRAAYISDGIFVDNLHFAAGIALCEAAGCAVSDLAGGPLHADRGLIIAADTATHRAVVELTRPHLLAVQRAS